MVAPAATHPWRRSRFPPHRRRFAAGVQQGLTRLVEAGRLPPPGPGADRAWHHGQHQRSDRAQRAAAGAAGHRRVSRHPVRRAAALRPSCRFVQHRPPPLIPRRMVFEINERLLADGSIDTPLHPDDAVRAARAAGKAGAAGASRSASCMPTAIRPTNAPPPRRSAPRCPASTWWPRHEVWPQAQEYERACAALLNAYARQAMAGYLDELDRFCRKHCPTRGCW